MLGGLIKGRIKAPVYQGDGAEVESRFTKLNEFVVTLGRGQYGELCSRGLIFRAGVTAVTIPQIAATLASVASFYNPPDSGIDMEIIDISISQVLAATVVNSFGLYADATAALSALATLTTLGTPRGGRIGVSPANKGRFYSALTHSGTPVKVANIGQDGAVTNLTGQSRRLESKGGVILPPGFAASIAASTAPSTTSGMAIDVVWAELPAQ